MKPAAQRAVFGVRPVEGLIQRAPHRVEQILTSRSGPLARLLALAAEAKVALREVSAVELDKICGGGSHQGVVALVAPFEYLDLHDIAQPGPGARQVPLLLALDSVTDPQNLGAIFRSALALGATGLVIPKDRAAQVTPAVTRISAGATEFLPCARVTNLSRALEELKQLEHWIAGSVESGGKAPCSADLTDALTIVVGSEQCGVRPNVLRRCDYLLTIPAVEQMAALNVSAAATVLLYEAVRQRTRAA